MPERGFGGDGRAQGGRLACVTVTYHPDLAVLRRQLSALPAEAIKILVDNGSGDAIQCQMRDLAAEFTNVLFFPQQSNLGLSAAINFGVRELAACCASRDFILLLDQDSEPLEGSIDCLCAALKALEAAGKNPGAVGPQMRDIETGLPHGFHQMSRWRWLRKFPAGDDLEPIPVSNLNGSGTLMRRAVFERLGGLDEALFIDHVDTDWSFRLLAAGYTLWGIPNAAFLHRMGERSLRFWLFGWRVWPARSPLRHRYLFRNALWLMRRTYVPRVWKIWAVVKLMLTAFVHAVFDPSRGRQLLEMASGVREGLRPPGKARP